MAGFEPQTRGQTPPAPKFSATTRELGEATLVEMHGELDLSHAEAARAELLDAARRSAPLLVADLRRLGLIDSTGLAVLIEVARRVRPQGELALLCPGGLGVHGALAISGVLAALEVFESEADVERYAAGLRRRGAT